VNVFTVMISPTLLRTIRKRYDNIYKEYLVMAFVVCRNMVENCRSMKIYLVHIMFFLQT